MNKASQMNGLYPIIRRVRRPLLPVEETVTQQADAKPEVPVVTDPPTIKKSVEDDQVASSEKDS
jgi:hypothetical protein